MMLLGFIFIITLPGCLSSPLPNVTCMIINLEYVNCTWNEQGIPDYNYTFYSRFGNQPYTECPEYLREGVHTVGCKRPYGRGQKFDMFYSKLSCPHCAANNTSERKQESDLRDRVKLDPPHNLSLAMQSRSELWLYWNISAMSSCVESEVGYRKSTDQEDGEESWGSWTNLVVQANSFRLHFPSSSNRYAFRVRTRVQANCRESMWSDWSSPVLWGEIKQKNNTVPGNQFNGTLTMVVSVICSVVVLVVLACLLVQNERLRVILIPIVPNPSKTLEDLIYIHNGNVEEWLNISKDFVEGFKPNFSEPVCPVREYNLVPQTSISGSECSLPILMDQSDCLSSSCSTSSSSLPSPPENTQPSLV
ncbi:interleukin 2 receptor, gamma a [Megalops cyprinoides]|uniref:interleukin 2 receptor, gamma a n=1 Tax=Megalops cyprinoides TaxID=118141 RepID=UPI001864C23F|nr:interleukin 2 receptor, gamma a [Megalops cyprinoides]